ncbi:heparinase II/III family protein [Peribacillus butanolivorans]
MKGIIIVLALALSVLIVVGERMPKATYSTNETTAFNDNIELKTVREEKDEEYNSIDKELLSQLKSNKMDRIIKRYEPKNDQTIKLADALLKNEIYVGDKWEPVKIDNPTWLENPYNDDSWVLYYQSLDFLPYLLNAYEETGKKEYLEKASFFVFEWIKSNRNTYSSVSDFAWNDHGTSNRLLNLIQFWKSYRESDLYTDEDAKELIYSLVQHGKFLYQDANYTKSNHGIMQDQALMELSILFSQLPKANEWFEKADKRILDSIKRDVAKDGVHKEHSPSYHTFVKGLFIDIKNFMNHYDKYDGEFDTTLKSMEKYEKYLVMPDRHYPLLGDSEDTKVGGINELPLLKDAVFNDGGVAFFRNNWDTAVNPLYFMFTDAYHSVVHKHADDLSFILSYGETDYFVDSGKYNYATDDPYRQYITSIFAHNSIAVNDESYDIKSDKLVGKSEITEFESKPSYSYVTGQHSLYNNVEIERTVIYLKPSNMIIHDRIISDEKNKYSQIFNIGENVKINKLNDQEFLLESQLDSTSIKLTQLESDDIEGVDIYKGSEDPIRGWQSYTLNEKHPITSVYFNKKGKNQSYMTVINLDRNESIQDVKYSAKQDSYEIEMTDDNKVNIEKQ